MPFHFLKGERVPTASDNTTDLWWLDLDGRSSEIANWERLLPVEELERASGFATLQLQQRFLAAQAALRVILASYCGESPRSLSLHRSASGKPALSGTSTLEFNLSHSAGVALLAISQGQSKRKPLGVDLEQLRPNIDWRGIAGQAFHPREQSAVEEWAERGFFGIWTRKEAWLKALGTGWTDQAKQVCVIPENWNPDQSAVLPVEEASQTFWIRGLPPLRTELGEWAAALCLTEAAASLCWKKPEDFAQLWAEWG